MLLIIILEAVTKEHCQCKREEVEGKILLVQSTGDVVRCNGEGFLSLLEGSLLSLSESSKPSNSSIHHWIFRLSIADQHFQDITCLESLSFVSYLFYKYYYNNLNTLYS